MPGSNKVFDSSSIPGEIIDLLVINTDTLKANPKLGKALVGAWYEIMELMSGDDEKAIATRTYMAEASGTDLAGFDRQLASTEMFYTPAEALALTGSEALKSNMQSVAEFSYKHGLLGDGAPTAEFIGIETPKGVYGDPSNIKLRFDPTYMQLAADAKL
jgi:NitT/TauT family transport system substrate-binding protein